MQRHCGIAFGNLHKGITRIVLGCGVGLARRVRGCGQTNDLPRSRGTRHCSLGRSRVMICACPPSLRGRQGIGLLGTGLLEHGLEVRLRGLQSLMVSHDPANSQQHPYSSSTGNLALNATVCPVLEHTISRSASSAMSRSSPRSPCHVARYFNVPGFVSILSLSSTPPFQASTISSPLSARLLTPAPRLDSDGLAPSTR